MGTPIVNLRQLVSTEVDSNVDIAAVHTAQTKIADSVAYVDIKANNIAGEVSDGVDTLNQHTETKVEELDNKTAEEQVALELTSTAEQSKIAVLTDQKLAEYNDNAIGDGSDDPDTGGKLGYFNHNYAIKQSLMQSTYDEYVQLVSTISDDVAEVFANTEEVRNLYDNFDDRWLGPLADHPTADNDGEALLEGALYWNTTNNVLMINSADLGGWVQGTVSANTVEAIHTIEDVIPEIQTLGDEVANKMYEGDTKSSVEVLAAIVSDVSTAATLADSIPTVANDSDAINEIYNNRNEIYAADDNAAIATTKASEASDSADAAATSETNASTSESNAAASAQNSLDAKDLAESARDQVAADKTAIETIYDNFDDRYLGHFATADEPTVDNDGNDLLVGALYWDTDVNELKFYNSTTWESPEKAATDAAQAASTSATNAANSEAAAASSESNSVASKDLAEKWASEAVDTEVADGKYSAMHYAEKANVDKMVWKGDWSSDVTYEKNDVVRYGTNNYIVVVDTTTAEPTVDTDWVVSLEGATATYEFTQDGTELVISSSGVVSYPIEEGEW